MVPPVLFLPTRVGGFERFPHIFCADAFCREPHCRAEADNLSAVKVFCPKRGSRWRDCRPRASNFAALLPSQRVCGNIPEGRTAKCHKIYNDIIPHKGQIVNSYLIKENKSWALIIKCPRKNLSYISKGCEFYEI